MKKILLKISAPVLAAAVLTGCGRAEIDPNDYLEYSFSGLDTAAAADFNINYEKMVADHPKAFGIKDTDSRAAESAVENLEEYLGGAPDRSDMLSNGDTVTFEWERGNIGRLEDKYRIKLSVSDKKITVDGLEEAVRFDPFEYIDIDYSGVEPEGEMILSSEGLPVMGIPFTAEPSDGLSNGDKVKVRFGTGSEDEITGDCFSQGFVPECFEKEFTVRGIPVYVGKLSDIGDAAYDGMDGYAQEELRKLADSRGDKKLCDIKLIGAELYTPAEDIAKWGRNALCFVYSMTAEPAGESDKKSSGSREASKSKKTEYYSFACFMNVFTPDNGSGSFPAECIKLPSYSEFYSSIYGDAFKDGDVVIEGFRSVDDLRDAVSDRFENSICESDIEDITKPE